LHRQRQVRRMAAQRGRSAHDRGDHQQLHGKPGVLRGNTRSPQPRSPIPSSTTSCLAPSSVASASTMCFVPETPPSWRCASPPRCCSPSCQAGLSKGTLS
jgi:hypothetical protein